MKTGAQLYTVRDFCTNLDDFAQTLEKIAAIGYKTVQVSGVCAYEAGWLKEQLDKNGLECAVTHTAYDKFLNTPDKVALDHLAFGCKYAGIGSAPNEFANPQVDYDRFLAEMKPAAQTLKAHGVTFCYHNHQYEFNKLNGEKVIDKMTQDFSLDELSFILDTYWVQFSGGDPAEWIKKLKGRVQCVHLKDMQIINSTQKMAVIGEGNINFDSVLSACEASGTEYLLVEQDDCNGENPFDCLERSYKYLKSIGL